MANRIKLKIKEIEVNNVFWRDAATNNREKTETCPTCYLLRVAVSLSCGRCKLNGKKIVENVIELYGQNNPLVLTPFLAFFSLLWQVVVKPRSNPLVTGTKCRPQVPTSRPNPISMVDQ